MLLILVSTVLILTKFSDGQRNPTLNPPYQPTFEAFYSGGVRITVPDDAYTKVSFYGFLNQTTQTKQWQMHVPRPKNRVWTMLDRNLKLNLYDTIDYSIYIMKNGYQFPFSGRWNVTEFVNEDGSPPCLNSKTELPCRKKVCTDELIFSEDFHDQAEVFKRWRIEKMFPQQPDYPFNAYTQDAINIEDDKLKINPILTETSMGSDFLYKDWDLNEDCTGQVGSRECYQVGSGAQILPPVMSGKITTKNSFNFKYGRVEVRAKLPLGDWLIPEINLEPRDHEYGRLHYGSGLLRVAYTRGNERYSNMLYGGPVCHDAEPIRSMFLKEIRSQNEDWGQDFHNYTLIWRPRGIELFVDGQNYGTMVANEESDDLIPDPIMKMQLDAYTKGTSFAPLDKMFYISLGVRVGGIHDFKESPRKPWKNTSPKAIMKFWENKHLWHSTWNSPELIVDYVKVYAL